MNKFVIALFLLWAPDVVVFAGSKSPLGDVNCPNWSGLYIGGFGGYTFSSVENDLELAGSWDGQPPARDQVEGVASDLDNNGAAAGGLIGYNFQLQKWILGLEADGGYLWARNSDSKNSNRFRPSYALSSSFKTHYLFTIAPRIGYAFCNWMPYVTGGLAVGDLEFSQQILDVGSRQLPFFVPPTFRERGSKSQTNAGWMVGGGLEYALTDHWHIRAGYEYVDLGDVAFHTVGSNDLGFPGPLTGDHKAALREHNASFALIYQF